MNINTSLTNLVIITKSFEMIRPLMNCLRVWLMHKVIAKNTYLISFTTVRKKYLCVILYIFVLYERTTTINYIRKKMKNEYFIDCSLDAGLTF